MDGLQCISIKHKGKQPKKKSKRSMAPAASTPSAQQNPAYDPESMTSTSNGGPPSVRRKNAEKEGKVLQLAKQFECNSMASAMAQAMEQHLQQVRTK